MESPPGFKPVKPTTTPTAPPELYYFFSAAFVVAALVFGGVGLYKLYDEKSGAIFVGEALALICAGILCAVLSVTFALFGHSAKEK